MTYKLLSASEYPNSSKDKILKINNYIDKYNNLEPLIDDIKKQESIANEKSYKIMKWITITCFILFLSFMIYEKLLNFSNISLSIFASCAVGIISACIFSPKTESYLLKMNELDVIMQEIKYLQQDINLEKQKAIDLLYREKRRVEEADSRKLVSGWTSMSGHVFEKQVGELYRQMGYFVEVTKGSGDGGIDIYLEKSGIRYAVQCKNHNKPISPAAVRDLYGAMMHDRLSNGVFISSGGFTKGAREFAKGKMELLEVRDLVRMNSQIMVAKNLQANSGNDQNQIHNKFFYR